ncbi:helix-turn-helix transcriptional regulator [Enterococcus avium]|uniref:Helix-turn-helix transcriptional regulator n=1 Tax=Enterococcus avium TaxID=33945 RepID=A0ABD5F6I8_ENTAV|nr:helix-turn-helix transcriptional regulator [Enterococcus avium]MBS6068344.1 helix-turn-helix transcriptional regulator [Enterococcus avium]MDT2514001.1 helix-turn-helix transcriptional regulator [Enterococcus avium]
MEENSNLKVGFALKRIRQMKSIEGKKYTQAMMAKDLGVGQSYIGGLENNTRTPSFKTLIKISDALGISLRNLIDLCEYQQLTEKYSRMSENKTLKPFSYDELTNIGTPEALAFRDVTKTFDFENLNFKLGEFLDNIDLKKKIYEGESFPYIDSTNLSDVLSKGINKQKNIFFNNQKLTDGQILGLNQYLEAITNQNNGGV